MTKALLALTGATIAAAAAISSPADARHYSNVIQCSGWRNGQCTSWNRLTVKQARRIQVGYVFPKNYTYTDFSSLPQTIVTQYSLSPDSHYVSSNGYIWVVDPNTNVVTKVITLPGG